MRIGFILKTHLFIPNVDIWIISCILSCSFPPRILHYDGNIRPLAVLFYGLLSLSFRLVNDSSILLYLTMPASILLVKFVMVWTLYAGERRKGHHGWVNQQWLGHFEHCTYFIHVLCAFQSKYIHGVYIHLSLFLQASAYWKVQRDLIENQVCWDWQGPVTQCSLSVNVQVLITDSTITS